MNLEEYITSSNHNPNSLTDDLRMIISQCSKTDTRLAKTFGFT